MNTLFKGRRVDKHFKSTTIFSQFTTRRVSTRAGNAHQFRDDAHPVHTALTRATALKTCQHLGNKGGQFIPQPGPQTVPADWHRFRRIPGEFNRFINFKTVLLMASLTDQIRNFFGGNETDQRGLQGLFVNELKGIYYAEQQFEDALQEQADASTSDELRNGFLKHKEETRNQIQRLEQIFGTLGMDPDEMTCNAADGLVDDAQMVVSTTESGSLTRDAGLIIAGQKVEHHEIAAYGSLHTLARVLGYQEAAQLLEQSLQEEKNTDKQLTKLAESFVNQQAAGEMGRNADNDNTMSGGTRYGSTGGSAMGGDSNYSGTGGSDYNRTGASGTGTTGYGSNTGL